MCIVQSKKQKMGQALTKALLGGEIIADLENASEVYAIATDYHEWQFAKTTDDGIFVDACTLHIISGIPTKESVAKIAGKIYAILTDVLDK